MKCPKCDEYNIYAQECCTNCGFDFEKRNNDIFFNSKEKKEMKEKCGIKESTHKKHYYKMGEEIANGILYWRKVSDEKNDKNIMAEMICHCGEKFIGRLHNIVNGSVKRCSVCRNKKKEKK